jgi:hypothetical protein
MLLSDRVTSPVTEEAEALAACQCAGAAKPGSSFPSASMNARQRAGQGGEKTLFASLSRSQMCKSFLLLFFKKEGLAS